MTTTEAKIECQCGGHFIFDLESVAGHAPQNLLCPSCGNDVTQACESFLRFLGGETAEPQGDGTRALKEIKVPCVCGFLLKLDLELSQQHVPGILSCPSCNSNLSNPANEQIRNFISTHALRESSGETGTAVDTPATSEAAAPPVGSKRTPGLAHRSATRPENTSPSRPATSVPIKGPGSRAAPVRASSQLKKTGQTSRLESRSRPSADSSRPAIGGAIGGAVLGIVIWYVVARLVGPNANFLACLPGLGAGLGARLTRKEAGAHHGAAAAGAAMLSMGLMAYVLAIAWVDRQAVPQIRSAYQSQLALAKSAVAAKSDQETRRVVGETTADATTRLIYRRLGPETITPELIASWKETELPKLRALADGSHTRVHFEREQLPRFRAAMQWNEAFFAGFGLLGLIFAAGGILGAFKIGTA